MVLLYRQTQPILEWWWINLIVSLTDVMNERMVFMTVVSGNMYNFGVIIFYVFDTSPKRDWDRFM